jgi:hypothetical protein
MTVQQIISRLVSLRIDGEGQIITEDTEVYVQGCSITSPIKSISVADRKDHNGVHTPVLMVRV